MTAIPWSAEAERRLRRWILLLQMMVFFGVAAGLSLVIAGFISRRFLVIMSGFMCLMLAVYTVLCLSTAWTRLGYPETISGRARIPGSGMLANKPRDTSRLTRWKRWNLPEEVTRGYAHRAVGVGFYCECGRFHEFADMKWIPNVAADDEEILDRVIPVLGQGREFFMDYNSRTSSGLNCGVAIDPGGGRWVLICECGVGHYMLREAKP